LGSVRADSAWSRIAAYSAAFIRYCALTEPTPPPTHQRRSLARRDAVCDDRSLALPMSALYVDRALALMASSLLASKEGSPEKSGGPFYASICAGCSRSRRVPISILVS
jgi:hypothetical protein